MKFKFKINNKNHKEFKYKYKSCYNEIDIEILKECRTIPPIGEINLPYYLYKIDKDDKYFYIPEMTTEIDVRKIYISTFLKIPEMSVFPQFDIGSPSMII